jgi:hypothetical protein
MDNSSEKFSEQCARRSSSISDQPVTAVAIKIVLLSCFLMCGPILPRVLVMFISS